MQVIFKKELATELQTRFENRIEEHLERLKKLLDNEYYQISWVDVQNEIEDIKELESRINNVTFIWDECKFWKD